MAPGDRQGTRLPNSTGLQTVDGGRRGDVTGDPDSLLCLLYSCQRAEEQHNTEDFLPVCPDARFRHQANADEPLQTSQAAAALKKDDSPGQKQRANS